MRAGAHCATFGVRNPSSFGRPLAGCPQVSSIARPKVVYQATNRSSFGRLGWRLSPTDLAIDDSKINDLRSANTRARFLTFFFNVLTPPPLGGRFAPPAGSIPAATRPPTRHPPRSARPRAREPQRRLRRRPSRHRLTLRQPPTSSNSPKYRLEGGSSPWPRPAVLSRPHFCL